MDKINRQLKIPESFRPFFWNVDFDNLDPEKNNLFVINRLFNMYNTEAFIWVEENYTKEEIIEAIKTLRDWHAVAINFLKDRYDVPENEINFYKMGCKKWKR